nr:P3 protein-like [Cherax quadricarinatus]
MKMYGHCDGASFPRLLPLLLALVSAALTAQVFDQEAEAKEDERRETGVVEPAALMQVMEGTQHTLTWYSSLPSVANVTATVEDEVVAAVVEVGEVLPGAPTDNFTYYGNITISALFIGYNKLHLSLYDDRHLVVWERAVDISVVLSYQHLADLFTLLVGILIIVFYINMGATINLEVVKNIITRPVGPVVGLICQYLFMPLIAFGVGWLTFPENPLGQLGFFLAGCCPGGGASNLWTHLLGGSLDLSVMMTFVSSVLAFGRAGASGVITYMLTQHAHGAQSPIYRVAKGLRCLLTPLALIVIIFTFTFGVYANRYVFSLFDVKSLAAGLALPSLGYLCGMALASMLRLPRRDTIAISIETGIQNLGVAIVILRITLEKPAGDLTSALPAAVVVMTPLPLLTALIIYRIYLCCHSDKPQLNLTFSPRRQKRSKPDREQEEGGRASVLNHQAKNTSGGSGKPQRIDLKEELSELPARGNSGGGSPAGGSS